jgi:hypothetical protein
MIIWCASYPRSGSHYLRYLLWRYYGLKRYTVYPRNNLPITSYQQNIINLFGGNIDQQVDIETTAKSRMLYFVKTHEMPQDDYPAIYLVRDGRDSLVSYAHFIQTLYKPNDKLNALLYDLITNAGYFGGWCAHVLAWTQRKTKTHVIRFEDLTQSSEPSRLVKTAIADVACHLPEKEPMTLLPTFAELHQLNPIMFRKGKINGWRDEMPQNLHDLFWEKHGQAMEQMGFAYNGLLNNQHESTHKEAF